MRDTFHGVGEVSGGLLAVDWCATPLGHPEHWPLSLQAAVRTLISTESAMWMAWGPDLTFLCNDAFRGDPVGARYAPALGQPASSVWAQIWPEIGRHIERVLSDRVTVRDEKRLFFLERDDSREEVYRSFTYVPLADDAGDVVGVLCVVAEDTEEVVAHRRLQVLRDLGTGSLMLQAHTDDDIVARFSAVVDSASLGLPFHLVYLYADDGTARLAGSGGFGAGHHPAAPDRLCWDGSGEPWPAPRPLGEPPIVVDGLADAYPDLPTGGWSTSPTRAAVLPVECGRGTAYGLLVVGLNPHRPFDSAYADFLQLVAAQLGSALRDGRARELERQHVETLAHLDQAQELARLGSWEVDLRTGRVVSSEELSRILGHSPAELEAMGYPEVVSRIIHPDDQALVLAALADASAGSDIGYEARVLRPDGREIFVSVNGVGVEADDGGLILRGSLQDVTDRRDAAHILAATQTAAEVAAREHEIAEELQRSLLPEHSFDLRHLEVATYYRAGVAGTQVGGDWYDVIELSAGRTALVIGDVMGRGVAAAAVMGQIRAAVRAYAHVGLPPVALLESLDGVVRGLAPDQIVTCVYAVFDPADLMLRFANAGHLPPLASQADGSTVRLGGDPHPPLGVGTPFTATQEVQLTPGARVLFYTDGLVERRGEDLETAIEHLRAVAAGLDVPLEQMPEALVRARLPEGISDDDVAVLVARVPAMLHPAEKLTTVSSAGAGDRRY